MDGPSDIPDIEDIARFLRRFSDLMSTGNNAEYLLRAATLLEHFAERTTEAERSLAQETAKNEANAAFHELVMRRSADLETEIAEQKDDIARLEGERDEALSATAAAQRDLHDQKTLAEAELEIARGDLAEARGRLAMVGNTHILMSLPLLHQAQGQFEALARQARDIVTQVMCEVGASTLERAIAESAVHEPVASPKAKAMTALIRSI